MARKDWITEEARETLLKILAAPPFGQSADGRGHSVTEAVRLPPSYDARIGQIASDTVLPYRDKSAVLRDCIHIGLQVIGLRGGQQLGISEVDVVASDLADFARLGFSVQSVMQQIRQLRQMGSNDLADKADAQLRAAIAKEPTNRRVVLERLLSQGLSAAGPELLALGPKSFDVLDENGEEVE